MPKADVRPGKDLGIETPVYRIAGFAFAGIAFWTNHSKKEVRMNIKKTALVGIDVSYKTFNAHYGGKDCVYGNNRKGWQRLAKEAPANSTYAMEATGNYHYRLAAYLHSKGFKVVVFNPYFVKHWLQSLGSKAKTDRIDARGISLYALAKEAKPKEWKPLSPLHARARVIVSLLSGLSRLGKSAGNINHSISLVVGRTSDMLDVMAGVSGVCREREKVLEKELVEIVKKLFPDQFRLLRTIPSLGNKTAAILLVCCKGFDGFAAYRQLVSFAGLAPKVVESGTSIRGRSRISKTGNSYLRALLFMCALGALSRCVPCRDLYERLTARGKPKKVAIVAVMHRLVKIAFGVVQSGEPYRGNSKQA
jgi:transposase